MGLGHGKPNFNPSTASSSCVTEPLTFARWETEAQGRSCFVRLREESA